MNTIKQIFQGVTDKELVHHKFTRYGKGDYERFLISGKKGKDLKVKASAGWCGDLLGLISTNITEDAEVSGKIICNYDFESEIPCEVAAFTKRGKLYTAELKDTVSPEVLKDIYEKFKLQFLLVGVKSSKYKLKCGKSLPKPGGKIKDNFCSATMPLELKDELFFGIDDFKEVKIIHHFTITDIKVPEEFKDDPIKARLNALRIGTVKRIIEADEKISETEAKLEA